MALSNGQGEIFLCRESINAGGGGEHGCKRNVELELSQIDPELAAKVAQLAGVNERLAKELEGLQGSYKALKAFMDALEKRVDGLGKSLFDVLTEGDFKGYEQELVEVIDLIRSHKASIDALKGDANKALADAKADAEAVKAALEDVLRRDGTTIDDVSVSVPEIGDLEIPLPEPEDQSDPFDPANDPYDKIADATIELLQRNWPDRRFEILISVNAWNQKQKDMEAGLAARAHVSPAELAAYHKSIRKVRGFILDTGCDGKGCLTDDGWFTDTPVPPDVRKSLKAEVRTINPVKAELLEEQMRLWKRDEANQKKIIAGVQALAGAARTLGRLAADDSAYLRGRLDVILTSTLEAAKNGACLAGRMAPGVNDFGDWYETVVGKDLCSGDELPTWQRALSGVGIIAGSGKLWRSMGEEISGIAQVARRADEVVEDGKKVASVRWGMWVDLPKKTVNGKEYAAIGERLYTQHAIERMTPSGFGSSIGRGPNSAGRGVPTVVVEYVLQHGNKIKSETTAAGFIRETWNIDTIEVVTENAKEIVITVMRKGG